MEKSEAYRGSVTYMGYTEQVAEMGVVNQICPTPEQKF